MRVEGEDDEAIRAPRVCGDDPINRKYGLDVSVCSPRMRG